MASNLLLRSPFLGITPTWRESTSAQVRARDDREQRNGSALSASESRDARGGGGAANYETVGGRLQSMAARVL